MTIRKLSLAMGLILLSGATWAEAAQSTNDVLFPTTNSAMQNPISTPATKTNMSVAQGANVGDGYFFGLQGGLAAQTQKNYSYAWWDDTSLPASVFGARVGYGYTFGQHYYLGGILEGNWQDVDSSNTAATIGTQFDRLVALSLMPGYHFSSSNLLYGKVGFGQAHYTASAINNSGNPYSDSGNSTIGVLGLGYSTAITSNLSIGLEYDYYYLFNSIKPIPTEDAWYQRVNDQMYLLTLTYQMDNINLTNSANRPALRLAGPYVGISAGTEVSNFQQTSTANSGNTGFANNIHIGYGFDFYSPFYLGVEAWTGTHSTSSTNYGGFVAREQYSYGFNLVPGYQITPSDLFFVKVGPQWTQITGQYSTGTDAYSKIPQGWLYGLGFETALTDSFSLTLEYDRMLNSYNTDANNYELTSNQFNIGVNYRF